MSFWRKICWLKLKENFLSNHFNPKLDNKLIKRKYFFVFYIIQFPLFCFPVEQSGDISSSLIIETFRKLSIINVFQFGLMHSHPNKKNNLLNVYIANCSRANVALRGNFIMLYAKTPRVRSVLDHRTRFRN